MVPPNAGEPPDFEEMFRLAAADGDVDIPEAGSLGELAIGQRVFYEEYRKAGFTTAQALYLTACAGTGNPGIAPPMEEE